MESGKDSQVLDLRDVGPVPVPEIDPAAWLWIWRFGFKGSPSDDELIEAFVAHPAFATHIHGRAGTHGVYRVEAVTTGDYLPATIDDIHAEIASWAREFPPAPPSAAGVEAIRVRMSELLGGAAHSYRLRDLGDVDLMRDPRRRASANDHAVFDELEAVLLLGWLEVLVVDRVTSTLTVVAASGD